MQVSTSYVGRAGVERFRRELLDTLDWFWNEPIEYRAGPRGALVVVRTTAKGLGSGVELTDEAFHILEIADGKLLRLTGFSERADAERAAGL